MTEETQENETVENASVETSLETQTAIAENEAAALAAAKNKEAPKADKKDEKEDEAPPEVDKLARAREAATRMSEQRRLRESAAREAAAMRYAVQQRDAELERLRHENEEFKSKWSRIEKDPLGYLREEKKLTADELARRAVEDADPANKLQRMQERLDSYEQRDREREAKIVEERALNQQNEARRQAESAFIDKAKDESLYPNLSLHAEARPRAIVREALEVIQEAHSKTGHVYSDEEALEYLEEVYSKITPKGNAAGSTKSNGAPETVTQKGNGSQGTKQAGKPRSLSGKDVAQSSVLPPNFDDLSDQEQKKVMADAYRRLATK